MARYMVEIPHTEGECMQVMEEMGGKRLRKFDFGCMSGNHTGWAKVNATNERSALNIVPASLRKNAKVTKVGKMTFAKMKAMHKE